MNTWVAMRTLHLQRTRGRRLPHAPRVISVPPLLRELILRVVELGPLRETAEHRRLLAVTLDQLRQLRAEPLRLPMPRDERALAAARAMRDGDLSPIEEIARRAATSRRTLERLFRRETGMPLGRWRRRARLLYALPRLAAGASGTRVAFEVEYGSPSAFIAAFRRAFGTTPGRYFRARSR